MPGDIANPELHTGQAVDGLGTLEFLAVHRAVESGNVLWPQEVAARLPAATIERFREGPNRIGIPNERKR
jgi:hypothetical protein